MQIIPINQYSMTSVSIHEGYELIHVRKAAKLFGFFFQVSFYKRAQILVADIWACFEGKSYGEFHDIDTITMFADYR